MVLVRPGVQFPALAVLMLIAFGVIVWRDAALQPRLFWDELTYSMASRHLAFANVEIPNYLYYALFRATRHCGDGFLQCARVLNAACFVAAMPFVYLVARRVSSAGIAYVITTCVAISPLNSYTAHFVPESSYMLGFWVLTWAFVATRELPAAARGTLLGTLLALLTLIKVHAVFLVPCLILAMAGDRFDGTASRRRVLRATLWLLLAYAVIRFGLGWWFAGSSGWSLLGTTYGAHARGSLSQGALVSQLPLAVSTLRWHVLAIVLMFGPAVGVILERAAASRPGVVSREFESLQRYALAVLLGLLAVSAMFNASVAAMAHESVDTVHARYYNFALPLLPILVAGSLKRPEPEEARTRPWILGAMLIGVFVLAWLNLRSGARALPIFAPELTGFTRVPQLFILLGSFSLACIVLWIWSRSRGARVFVCVYFPAISVATSVVVYAEARNGNPLNVYDRAGSFAQQNLGSADRMRLVVIGADGDAYGNAAARALLHIDSPGARWVKAPASSAVDPVQLPRDVQWLLQIGDRPVPAGARSAAKLNGFELIKLPGGRIVDFSLPLWPAVISRVEGVTNPSRPGVWIANDRAQLDFTDPLPSQARVRFGFAIRSGVSALETIIAIGKARREVRLERGSAIASVVFDNPDDVRQLAIEVLDSAGGRTSAPVLRLDWMLIEPGPR